MSLKQKTLSILCIGLLCLNAAAQPSTAAAPVQTIQRRAGQPKTPKPEGVALLREVIVEAQSLRVAENQAWVLMRAAAALWDEDPKGARVAFGLALNSANEVTCGTEHSSSDCETLARVSNQLREEILQQISRRDPELAYELFRAEGVFLQPDDEVRLQLVIAARMVEHNPNEALRIAENSLEKKVAYQLIDLIAQLYRSDRNAATRVMNSLLKRLRTEDLANNQEAASVAIELVRVGSEYREAGSKAEIYNITTLLPEETLRELVLMLANAALRPASSKAEMLSMVRPLLPTIAKYDAMLGRRLLRESNTGGHASTKHNGINDESETQLSIAMPTENVKGQSHEEHIAELIRRATEATSKSQGKYAIKLLGEAQSLIGYRAKNSVQLGQQLQVAQAYAVLDPASCLETIESMIEQLILLADATSVVDGFITEEQFAREDELLLRRISDLFSEILDDDASGLVELVRDDFQSFQRLKTAADRFQRRPEIRVMARLLLAQSVLAQESPSSLQK